MPFPPPAAPPKKGKGKSEPKPRPRNPLFDAVAPHVAGSDDPDAIYAARSQIGRVVKYLNDCKITAEDVPALVAFIRSRFVTPQHSINYGSWDKHTPLFISHTKGHTVAPLGDKHQQRVKRAEEIAKRVGINPVAPSRPEATEDQGEIQKRSIEWTF